VGYAHVINLYRPEGQTILLCKRCYCLEKLHGSSAHVAWKDGQLSFYAGGEKHARFVALFDAEKLTTAFMAMGHPAVTVFGEVYGGSKQGQAWRYGKDLRFAAFEAKVGDTWLAVPDAAALVASLGLEFVHYVETSTDLAALDAERDAPSEQARRNGVVGDKPREGIVIRPLVELTTSNGERVMAKHKRAEERETATERSVVDPSKLTVLTEANSIATEWATPTRLQHVLDKMEGVIDMSRTRDVIAAMTEDVLREGSGELVDSKEARAAIGKRTAELLKKHLAAALHAAHPTEAAQ
jgi:hypothetical protein